MDNLRNVIKILFRYTMADEVIHGDLDFSRVNKDSFLTLANHYITQYSNDEIENMLLFLSAEFEWHYNKMHGRENADDSCQVNVYDALFMFADTVLTEENGMPLCCYEHLLRWREMIVALDEDLFITAFLAQQDILHGKIDAQQRSFFWAPVIGHNNRELNHLMAQGVAENHFHLKGSAPLFHLSWISLMNDVTNDAFISIFEQYDKRRLDAKINYNAMYAGTTLKNSYLQAALIRVYLFSVIMQKDFHLDEFYADTKEVIASLCWDEIDRDEKQKLINEMQKNPKISLDWLLDRIGTVTEKNRRIIEIMQHSAAYELVMKLLKDPMELDYYRPEMQRMIIELREACADNRVDYMLWNSALAENKDMHKNEIISGERWFMYEMFKRVCDAKSGRNREELHKYLNLFYAYLLIKENIRAELVQSNQNVGFNNFLLYQNRKESFIEDTPFEPIYVRMAVRDTILNQHIRMLEARVTPKESGMENLNKIKQMDQFIAGDGNPSILQRYFYVYHFVKEADEWLEKDIHECRHFEKRNQVKRQALAIAWLRENGEDTAKRVLGIDACSPEIGCRPEVFAQAFRFLKGHQCDYYDYDKEQKYSLPNLCATYHVGEDFLDIIDGMRAIDEAVSFLNMRCGDRLGHALALGIDVASWYQSKSNYILLPQMDYLDNLVWLYAKIRKYHIEGCEDAMRYIEKRYDEYFRIIYLNNMEDADFKAVLNEARAYFDERQTQNHYGSSQYHFSISTYYDSWKLRGDNPQYFKSGYFKLENSLNSWDEHGINKEYPENYRIRYNPEAAYLYYLYHYSAKIKKEGNKRREIKIHPCIIRAADKVQRKMQWVICQKGIGIETNPSSNALISTFRRYDRHPITQWYNLGLATSPQDIANVPQLQVSINTDDQGVFATYIETEYAYLALALEKMRDDHGNPRYSRTLIYRWLDNIRKMGLAQCFAVLEDGIAANTFTSTDS